MSIRCSKVKLGCPLRVLVQEKPVRNRSSRVQSRGILSSLIRCLERNKKSDDNENAKREKHKCI